MCLVGYATKLQCPSAGRVVRTCAYDDGRGRYRTPNKEHNKWRVHVCHKNMCNRAADRSTS